MLADIASGEFDVADWLLLIAFILFVIDVVFTWVGSRPDKLNLTAAGLALVSFALMLW